MSSLKWYTDAAANQAFVAVEREIKGMVDKMFPHHEFSHMGINRNPDTDEIVIKLHINPIGQVKVVPEPSDEHRASREYMRQVIRDEMKNIYLAFDQENPARK